MKQEPLSPAQLQILVWTGLLAPAAEAFPKLLSGAGTQAWSAVLLGGLLALGLGRLMISRGNRPAHRLKQGLGVRAGTAVILLCLLWLQLLLTLRLELCADRLLLWGDRDGAQLFFLGVLTLLLLRLARLPLGAFARAGQLFFAALVLSGLLILLLALPASRPERLLPVGLPPLSPVLTAAGVLAGWAFPAAFLPVACEGRPCKLRRDLAALLLLTLAQGIILANLGPGLVREVDVPFFTLAKSVGVEGAFQRAESTVAALWIFADLVLAGVLVNAQRQLLGELTGHEDGAVMVLILCAAAGAWAGAIPLTAGTELIQAAGLLPALLMSLLIRLTEALSGG